MRLINADVLKQHIDKLPALPDGNFAGNHSALKALINMQPTVDAVPARHGKWVDENGDRPYGYRFNWLCSECGRPQHTSTAKLLKEFEEEHRWCHFCGARMDGKEGNGR